MIINRITSYNVCYTKLLRPFQPCIDLWNLGLVPSFDGTTWRLHKMCDNAKVIYEWKK